MKKVLVSVVLLFFSGQVFSAAVPVETAKKVAENWYYERGKTTKAGISIENYFVEAKDKDTLLYVFNINPDGFVIVSAEDIVIPLLGYSFKGHYTTSNHPQAFDDMLAGWEEQIIYAKKSKPAPSKQNTDEWSRLSVTTTQFIKRKGDVKNVGPLLTTTWNQGHPYDNQCPPSGLGHCAVGCVAVATAQVMKYYDWPPQGTGSYSYYDSCCQETVFADFNTTYDWANMPNSLSLVGADTTQANAVAKLLFHCGVSVGMCYGGILSGSGAQTYNDTIALVQHFYYDTSIKFVYKDSYDSSTWEGMMRTELDNGRPIIYSGCSSTEGHCFDMDGYQGTNYFHFNWGWGGSDDGYFYLNDLNPSFGDNFTSGQEAVIGIKPKPVIAPPVIAISPDTIQFTWDNSGGKKLSSSSKNRIIPTSHSLTELRNYSMRSYKNRILAPIPIRIHNLKKGFLYSSNPDSGWINYFNGTIYWPFSGDMELAVCFIPSDFSISYPLWITKVGHFFYEDSSSPWQSDEFNFRIYDGSGTTVLNESPVLHAIPNDSIFHFTEYDLENNAVKIDSGNAFVVSIYDSKFGADGATGDSLNTGYSFYKDSTGQWCSLVWEGGSSELSTYAFVSWGGSTENYDTVKTMTVQNVGGDNLSVTGITPSDSWIVGCSPTNFNLGAGQSQNVTVTVTSSGLESGTHYGSVSIYSNDVTQNPYIEQIKFVIVGVGTEENKNKYNNFTVSYFSNPVRGNVPIAYAVPYKMNVSIKLYDMTGRLVQTLEDGILEKGSYKRTVNVEKISAGVYFCRVQAGNYKETKKLVLMR